MQPHLPPFDHRSVVRPGIPTRISLPGSEPTKTTPMALEPLRRPESTTGDRQRAKTGQPLHPCITGNFDEPARLQIRFLPHGRFPDTNKRFAHSRSSGEETASATCAQGHRNSIEDLSCKCSDTGGPTGRYEYASTPMDALNGSANSSTARHQRPLMPQRPVPVYRAVGITRRPVGRKNSIRRQTPASGTTRADSSAGQTSGRVSPASGCRESLPKVPGDRMIFAPYSVIPRRILTPAILFRSII